MHRHLPPHEAQTVRREHSGGGGGGGGDGVVGLGEWTFQRGGHLVYD
jgi:hypothetical protein